MTHDSGTPFSMNPSPHYNIYCTQMCFLSWFKHLAPGERGFLLSETIYFWSKIDSTAWTLTSPKDANTVHWEGQKACPAEHLITGRCIRSRGRESETQRRARLRHTSLLGLSSLCDRSTEAMCSWYLPLFLSTAPYFQLFSFLLSLQVFVKTSIECQTLLCI